MKRNIYNMSSFCAVTGQIGALQTLITIPTCAGDSVSVNLNGALRLAELKRWLTIDVKVELFAFHVKHRHVLDENWVKMIKDGIKSEYVIPTLDLKEDTTNADYLGSVPNGPLPIYLVRGYNSIWNEYFRIDNVTDAIPEDTIQNSAPVTGAQNPRKYGIVCARLPEFWNTGSPKDRMTYQENETVNQESGGGIKLTNIEQTKSQYRDAIDKDWFVERYRDVLNKNFGVNSVNVDVDNRPELLMHTQDYLSGYNIDGTSDQNLGSYIGKSEGMVNFQLPRKYFKEHGVIWVMALLRFPPILQEQIHYNYSHSNNYGLISGDPNYIISQPPIELFGEDFVENPKVATQSWGMQPHSQQWRTQPSRIHRDFWGKEGFPFQTKDQLTTTDSTVFYDGTSISKYFGNEDLGQWNIVGRVDIEKRSAIPNASQSIFAGAN